MKKIISLLLAIVCAFTLFGCESGGDNESTAVPAENTEATDSQSSDATAEATETATEEATAEPTADNSTKTAKIIMLIGQSNAVGASIHGLLKKQIDSDVYEEARQGYDNIRIAYLAEAGGADGENCRTSFDFESTDQTIEDIFKKKANFGESWTKTYFGPEAGIAKYLHDTTPDEQYYIVKVAKGGVSINDSWVSGKYCYEKLEDAMELTISTFEKEGYTPEIISIIWIQGENEGTSETESANYYTYQSKLAKALRKAYKNYAPEGGIPFIAVGISRNWSYCDNVNAAKKKFAEEDPTLNYYFDTIEAGYTFSQEPVADPDYAHYDSLSMWQLGQECGRLTLEAYNKVK